MKPCTSGKRHKWSFIKNQIRTVHSGNSAGISQVGIYKCSFCEQKKFGAASINEVQS